MGSPSDRETRTDPLSFVTHVTVRVADSAERVSAG
jgi:hypothetical protein